LEIEGLSARTTDSSYSDLALENYKGIQITVLRHSDVNAYIDLTKLCSDKFDVNMGRTPSTGMLLLRQEEKYSNKSGQAWQLSVPFHGNSTYTREAVDRTGIYMLLVSNCGDMKGVVINGRMKLHHAYGYLPGNEYPKMTFYGWLVLAYVGLTVVWAALSIRWWSQLFRIHGCISVVLLFGVGESVLWNVFYHDWNIVGRQTDRGTILFVIALLFTVLKSTCSYMLVLVASLGWGVTKPQLANSTICKISVLCILYIGLAFTREVVLSFRHSHSIPAHLVLTVFAPISLLNAIIFCWIFTALGRLMETLKQEKQTEKFQLFLTLFAVLIAAIGVATLALMVEVYNLSRPPQAVWKHQWILTDAVSHLLFLLVLVAMMYLWAPHSESQRYAYCEQISGVDNDGDSHVASVADGDLRKLGGAETIGQAYMDEDMDAPPPHENDLEKEGGGVQRDQV
jgi:hypothetical protein